MPIYKIKAGQVPTVDATTYVGIEGTIFYDSTGLLRLSDGVTPGGIPISTGGGGGNGYTGSQGYTGSAGSGGGGVSGLPADANGVLYDDGFGNLSWVGIGHLQAHRDRKATLVV